MEDDGFGSPMGAAPGAVATPPLMRAAGGAGEAGFDAGFTFGARPRDAGGAAAMDASPLVFQRTPQSPASLRVESWMSSTGKYRNRGPLRTPPTEAMATAPRFGDDDGGFNPDVPASPALSSVRLMRRWLGATDSGNWDRTPGSSARRGVDQGPSPMSAAPFTGRRDPDAVRSRPLRDMAAEDDDAGDSDSGDDAATCADVAPRSPSLQGSPAAAAAPQPAATPGAAAAGAAAAAAPPPSPLQVIDLMMAPPSPRLLLRPRGGDANGAAAPAAAAGTPGAGARSPAGSARKPRTPEERVIGLMLRQGRAPGGAAADARNAEEPGAWREQAEDDDEDETGSEASGDSYGAGGGDSESDDEISVAELEMLCAEAAVEGAGGAAPDLSPIRDIIGLVLATPKGGAAAAGGGQAAAGKQDEEAGAGPRVLFAD